MPGCKICLNAKTNFFHQIKNFKYFLCQNCQTLFLYPQLSIKFLNQYYKKSFRYDAGLVEEKRIRTRSKIILKNLRKLNPLGKMLLDVGCGYGFFIDESKKLGIKSLGIEPNKKLSVTSINQLIEVKNLTFEEYFKKYKNKRFDFITLIHLIEHVKNPKQTIQSAAKLLNKNGILYIETPNLNSHLFWTEKQDYTFLIPPEHLWIFSKKSLETILQDIPLIEIIKTSTYSYSEHLMGIVKRKFEARSTKSEVLNFENSNLEFVSDFGFRISDLKYRLFDCLLAPLFTPFLNLGGYGSILELYIRKK